MARVLLFFRKLFNDSVYLQMKRFLYTTNEKGCGRERSWYTLKRSYYLLSGTEESFENLSGKAAENRKRELWKSKEEC